jgi:hypothetical protein
MMTDAERRLLLDLELMYDEWLREWGERVRNDTQPTREDERVYLLKLKKIMTDHIGVDVVNLEGYLK